MSNIVLGAGATTVNKTKFLLSRSLQSSGESRQLKLMITTQYDKHHRQSGYYEDTEWVYLNQTIRIRKSFPKEIIGFD